jgi:hypothetical protein
MDSSGSGEVYSQAFVNTVRSLLDSIKGWKFSHLLNQLLTSQEGQCSCGVNKFCVCWKAIKRVGHVSKCLHGQGDPASGLQLHLLNMALVIQYYLKTIYHNDITNFTELKRNLFNKSLQL